MLPPRSVTAPASSRLVNGRRRPAGCEHNSLRMAANDHGFPSTMITPPVARCRKFLLMWNASYCVTTPVETSHAASYTHRRNSTDLHREQGKRGGKETSYGRRIAGSV